MLSSSQDLPNSGSSPGLLCLLCWQVHSLPLSHLEGLNGVTCSEGEGAGACRTKLTHSAEARSSILMGWTNQLHSPTSPNGRGYLGRKSGMPIPRKRVESSLAAVKSGIQPKGLKVQDLCFTTELSVPDLRPMNTVPHSFCSIHTSYISYLSPLQLLSYF